VVPLADTAFVYLKLVRSGSSTSWRLTPPRPC
jgi:hypothetical protein